MILRKPYAFFIRMFKPIHLFVSFLIIYLIHLNNKILNFFNGYLTTTQNVVGTDLTGRLTSKSLYIIPVVIILITFFILGIMVRKKKPATFYFVNILLYVAVIVIFVYISNFLGVLEKSVVSIKIIKLMHDLTLINIIIESVTFVIFIIRGMGLNLKKFEFNSDISKFDIDDIDKEEFEFNILVDIAEAKRKRNNRVRLLKYKYLENKFLVNLCAIFLILIVVVTAFVLINSNSIKNFEGNTYHIDGLNIEVENTTILNESYKGKEITENNLIVVKCKMQSDSKVDIDDFNLKISGFIFKPTLNYSNYILDLGITYDNSKNLMEYNHYLFVFEVPDKVMKDTMVFNYRVHGDSLNIKLKPKMQTYDDSLITSDLGNILDLSHNLDGVKFSVSEYDIKNKYMIEYQYCITDNDCVNSREYIKPSLNENYDKVVLRMNVTFEGNSDLDLNSFYKLLNKFGIIKYRIGDTWYSQSNGFEELASNKIKNDKYIYVGIKSDIINADEIILAFYVRNSKYEYILRQVEHE